MTLNIDAARIGQMPTRSGAVICAHQRSFGSGAHKTFPAHYLQVELCLSGICFGSGARART